MNCRLCNKELKNGLGGRKYCGNYRNINDCAGKVSKLQKRFNSIKNRCTNPKHENFKYYKNIEISDKWKKDNFNFVVWALNNGWCQELQIDRIDNSKGYYEDNCRFVTRSENCRNKRIVCTDWLNKTRICRICKSKKQFYEFMTSRKEVGGIAYECKSCRKEIDHKRWTKIND